MHDERSRAQGPEGPRLPLAPPPQHFPDTTGPITRQDIADWERRRAASNAAYRALHPEWTPPEVPSPVPTPFDWTPVRIFALTLLVLALLVGLAYLLAAIHA